MQPREVLDVIELVYYIPALVLAVILCVKHGIGRQLGWIYLLALALLRIIGASTGIANYNHPSKGLSEASNVTYNIGLSPLVLMLIGILKRVLVLSGLSRLSEGLTADRNDGMEHHRLPPLLLNQLHLPPLAGIILAAIGGSDVFSSKSSDVDEGWTLTKVAVLIFLVTFIVLTLLTAYDLVFLKAVKEGERRLVFASIASIPFFVVRLVYALCVAFDHDSKYFSPTSTADAAVVLQAILSLCMEFTIVAIFIVVGFAVSKIPRGQVRSQGSQGLTGILLARRERGRGRK